MAMTFATDVNTNGYTVKADKISAPTSSGGTTFGAGGSGHIIKSNGTTIFWSNYANTSQQVTSSEKWRPILMANVETNASTDSIAAAVGVCHMVSGVAVQPSSGKLRVASVNINSQFRIEYNSTDESLDFTVTG